MQKTPKLNKSNEFFFSCVQVQMPKIGKNVSWKVPEFEVKTIEVEPIEAAPNELHFKVYKAESARIVDLPSDGCHTVVSLFGHELRVETKGVQTLLVLKTPVTNCAQLEARDNLQKRIRRNDKDIDHLLVQIEHAKKCGVDPIFMYQDLEHANSQFLADCALHEKLYPLDAETGQEVRTWTLFSDDSGVNAIYMLDLETGSYSEVKFWFSCVASRPFIRTPSEHVQVIEDCVAPYRPFKVPARWKTSQLVCK